MIWTKDTFYKMMIYDLQKPCYPPCQEINICFDDYQVKHYVSTLISLEVYLQSLRELTLFRQNQFRDFISNTLIVTNTGHSIKLSIQNGEYQLSDFKICDIANIIIVKEVESFDCPICLEYKMFPIRPFTCRHGICNDCLDSFRSSPNCAQVCPQCRSY